MANPRIVWDGNTIDFPDLPSDYRAVRRGSRFQSASDGNIVATTLRSQFDEVRVVLDKFTSAAFEEALVAWWSWAAQGRQYAFAYDSSKTISLTTTAALAKGATAVTLNSGVGLADGEKYVLRDPDGFWEEIVEVYSHDVAGNVVLAAGVKFAHATAATFRSRDYFPKVVALDDDSPVTEGLTTWTLDHRFREDSA